LEPRSPTAIPDAYVLMPRYPPDVVSLFQFQLETLADVAPWGDESRPRLSWFGLTSGHFGLRLGDVDVLRYDPQGCATRGWPVPEGGLHVDYYVVRLWEDVLEVLPFALAPLPEDVAALAGDRGSLVALRERLAHADEDAENDEPFALDALAFWSDRTVDTGYLKEGPHLHFWSKNDTVQIRYEARASGARLWDPELAEHAMSRDAFVDEVVRFHERLIDEMAQRVEACAAGARPDVEIDLAELRHEHADRATLLAKQLSTKPPDEDWTALRAWLATGP
jgi:hypothetical protein